MSLENLRKQYILDGLSKSDLESNPVQQFQKWFEELQEKVTDEDFELNAMAVATGDAAGRISNRIVLLKGYDETGFRFFTNYESSKALDLQANPHAALLFYWPQLERQVRIEGTVSRTDRALSKKYFDSRPRMSRISAVISPQSQPVPNRKTLDQMAEKMASETGDAEIELPDYWGGYEVKPYSFEFWQGRQNRLHDRLQYYLEEGAWKIQRLGP